MGATKKPRKKYRPKPVYHDQVMRSIEGAGKLRPEDQHRIASGVARAFEFFRRGEEPGMAWRVMADALNVAETMADMGLCSDADSRELILVAQDVLGDVAVRHKAGAGWALRGTEMQLLKEALDRHEIQLQHCSVQEYQRAIEATKARIAGAVRGGSKRHVIVLGDLPN